MDSCGEGNCWEGLQRLALLDYHLSSGSTTHDRSGLNPKWKYWALALRIQKPVGAMGHRAGHLPVASPLTLPGRSSIIRSSISRYGHAPTNDRLFDNNRRSQPYITV